MAHRSAARIEPELLSAPPRKVRLRLSSLPPLEPLGVLFPTLERFHLYAYLVVAIPVFWAVEFIFRLVRALIEVSHGKLIFNNILPLVFVTIISNVIAWSMVGHVIKTLIQRWLVINGEATIGQLENVSVRKDFCLISYSFHIDGEKRGKGRVLTKTKLWEKQRAPEKELTILYSTKNPRWNTPYLLSGYEVVSEASSEKNTGSWNAKRLGR